MRLILGSASPRRLQLLAQIGITPDQVVPADIDETPHTNEKPPTYVTRIARGKNDALAARFAGDIIVTADTTVAVGRRILGKAENATEATAMLGLLSGRAHHVLTALCVRGPDGRVRQRLSTNRVQVKRLDAAEIAAYIAGDEWQDKAGAYGFQGTFAQHIRGMQGSASGIIGLPLYETALLLKACGIKLA